MNPARRRGYIMLEMIAVLAILIFAGGIARMVFDALIDANARTARFTERYAALQDFFGTLERDVRRSSAIEARNEPASGEDMTRLSSQFTLVSPSSRIVYILDAEGVMRMIEDIPDAVKRWDTSIGSLKIDVLRDAAGRPTILTATVTWRRTQPATGFQPNSTFTLVARCTEQEADHDR